MYYLIYWLSYKNKIIEIVLKMYLKYLKKKTLKHCKLSLKSSWITRDSREAFKIPSGQNTDKSKLGF